MDGDFSRATKEWRHILSTAPSDPYNIFSKASAQDIKENVPPTLTDDPLSPSTAICPNLHRQYAAPLPPASEAPVAPLLHQPLPLASSVPLRLLGYQPAVVGTANPTFISHTPLLPAAHVRDLSNRLLLAPGNTRIPIGRPRGLVGWTPRKPSDEQPQEVPLPIFALPPLQPPCPRPSALPTAPEITVPRIPFVPAVGRRPQRSTASSKSSTHAVSQPIPLDVDSDEGDDSDGYEPSSCSESIALSRQSSPSSLQFPAPESGTLVPSRPRNRGKAKGSAAQALAVVTRMSKMRKSMDSIDFLDVSDSYDPDSDSTEIKAGRKRKNHPIPLPVPVPHLTKKSRGRKVPDVEPEIPWPKGTHVELDDDDEEEEEEEKPYSLRGSRSSRSGRKPANPYSLAEGGKRTFKCEVAGCGKCFVRGEHLKRHVRSIHTYDKRASSISSAAPSREQHV